MEESWTSWRTSLTELTNLVIPRAYTEPSPFAAVHRELFVFSDALTKTIVGVADLKIPTNIDHNSVKSYLSEQACSWTLNPPHASHFRGAWEKMIGLTKNILYSMFLQLKDKLSHEVLVTFMAEVSAIINSRLLVPTDRDELLLLTPATLLTQKALPRPAPAGEFGPSASGGMSSICPTPSGTGGINSFSQHCKHERSGGLHARTSSAHCVYCSSGHSIHMAAMCIGYRASPVSSCFQINFQYKPFCTHCYLIESHPKVTVKHDDAAIVIYFFVCS